MIMASFRKRKKRHIKRNVIENGAIMASQRQYFSKHSLYEVAQHIFERNAYSLIRCYCSIIHPHVIMQPLIISLLCLQLVKINIITSR